MESQIEQGIALGAVLLCLAVGCALHSLCFEQISKTMIFKGFSWS